MNYKKGLEQNLYNDKIIGTINDVPLKAKHLPFFSHGFLTLRVAQAILLDIIPKKSLSKPILFVFSLANISNETALTMKYLPSFEPLLTTGEILNETRKIFIIFHFEKNWIFSVANIKDLEVSLFNALEMKIDFLISIIYSVLFDEYNLKMKKFIHFQTFDKEGVEFIDNIMPFYLLKYFLENSQIEKYEKSQILGSNFKNFKLVTFSKFNNLDPNHAANEKTNYLNNKIYPEYFLFEKKEYSLKFETKLIRYTKNTHQDLDVSTVFDCRPQNKKINLDDTIEFIENEESFSFDHSMEIVKELEKKNSLNVKSISETSSLLDNEEILPRKIKPKIQKESISSINSFNMEQKPKLKKIRNDFFEQKADEEKKPKPEKLAFTKKELKNIIIRHGALVKHSIEKEIEEQEELEEQERQEQAQAYYKAMQINKILWYYYIYFPEQYPLILNQYQQKLNKKLGLDDLPWIIPKSVSEHQPKVHPINSNESIKQQNNQSELLPKINNQKYRPDFNQSLNKDLTQESRSSIPEKRGRSHSKGKKNERKVEISLPNIKMKEYNGNNSTIQNNSQNQNENSLLQGFWANKPKKQKISPESQRFSKSKRDSSQQRHSNSKIVEKNGIVLFKDDIDNFIYKDIVSLNLMDYLLSYFNEKNKDSHIIYYLSHDFKDELLKDYKGTIFSLKNKNIVLFFPIVLSFSKLVYGLVLVYPFLKLIKYYEQFGEKFPDFLSRICEDLQYKQEFLKINFKNSGPFVLFFGYLLQKNIMLNSTDIDEKYLESFKRKISTFLYDNKVSFDQKSFI